MLGWSLHDERILDCTSRLERLELGTSLFASMSEAQVVSAAAFRSAHDRPPEQGATN